MIGTYIVRLKDVQKIPNIFIANYAIMIVGTSIVQLKDALKTSNTSIALINFPMEKYVKI